MKGIQLYLKKIFFTEKDYTYFLLKKYNYFSNSIATFEQP